MLLEPPCGLIGICHPIIFGDILLSDDFYFLHHSDANSLFRQHYT